MEKVNSSFEPQDSPEQAPLISDQLRILNEAILQASKSLQQSGNNYTEGMQVIAEAAHAAKELGQIEYAKGFLRVGRNLLDQIKENDYSKVRLKKDETFDDIEEPDYEAKGWIHQGVQTLKGAEGYGVLGRTYIELGDVGEGEKILNELPKKSEGRLQIYSALAIYYAEHGDSKKALQALREIEKVDRNDQPAYIHTMSDFRDTFIAVAEHLKNSPESVLKVERMMQRVKDISVQSARDVENGKQTINGDSSFQVYLICAVAKIQHVRGAEEDMQRTLEEGLNLIRETHNFQEKYDRKIEQDDDKTIKFTQYARELMREAEGRERELRILARAYIDLGMPTKVEELLQSADLEVVTPDRASGMLTPTTQGHDEARGVLAKWYAQQGNIAKAEDLLAGHEPNPSAVWAFDDAQKAILVYVYNSGKKYELHSRLNKATDEVKKSMGEYLRLQEAIAKMHYDQNYHRYAGWKYLEVSNTSQRTNSKTGEQENYIVDPLEYAHKLVNLAKS